MENASSELIVWYNETTHWAYQSSKMNDYVLSSSVVMWVRSIIVVAMTFWKYSATTYNLSLVV